MAKGLIYKATNKINGKSYVGQTIFTLAERIDGHIKSATKKDSPYHFHKAIRKYGEENFDWETICNCNGHSELNDKEIFYIKEYDTYDSGYNMTGGGGGTSGYAHTENTRLKMSKTREGRFNGEENSFYGKKHSEESLEKMRISTLKQFENGMPGETKKKISESTKGIPTSEETRKKMSEARKRYWENKKLQEVK